MPYSRSGRATTSAVPSACASYTPMHEANACRPDLHRPPESADSAAGDVVPRRPRRAHNRAPRGASFLELPVVTLPQPDETTCGPTCLHAIYRYWGDPEPLSSVTARMWRREHGGTYAVFLGCDALRKGYRARIYRRSRLDRQMQEQGLPERAPVAAQGARTQDADDPLRQRRPVPYTHLRAHETPEHLVCRLL